MHNPFARSQGSDGSFLPQDYVKQRAEMRANLLCLGLFGIVMFGVVGAFFVTNHQWLSVRREQRTITVSYTQAAQKIDQLKQLESQKSELMSKAEVTTALIERVPRSVLVAELVTRMPAEITLLQLDLTGERVKEAAPAKAGDPKSTSTRVKSLVGSAAKTVGGKPEGEAQPAPTRVKPPEFRHSLIISGVAIANGHIADYLDALRRCPLLEGVELKFIKEMVLDKRSLRKFEIHAAIRKDADGRTIDPLERLAGSQGTKTHDEESGAKDPARVTTVPEVPKGREE